MYIDTLKRFRVAVRMERKVGGGGQKGVGELLLEGASPISFALGTH